MIIQICIGSSCYLKGSQELVNMFQNEIERYNLSEDITLAGSFCIGKCNREGVTVLVDDEIFTGVTKDIFKGFFNEHVLRRLIRERGET